MKMGKTSAFADLKGKSRIHTGHTKLEIPFGYSSGIIMKAIGYMNLELRKNSKLEIQFESSQQIDLT